MTAIQTGQRDLGQTYEGICSAGVTAGYTLPSLSGDVEAQMPQVLSALGVWGRVAYMDQVHGSEVKIVDAPGRYRCDGIFTRAGRLALVVRTADCLPLIFSSETQRVAGVVHMGWRSAEAGILENIGHDLSSFTCVAGVGLRACCYEVGAEFLQNRRVGPFVIERNGAHIFDAAAFARHHLVRQGLEDRNFHDAAICSYCSPGRFHSHRKTGTKDRTLNFIVIDRRTGGGPA